MSDELPTDVQRLIAAMIKSVAELEAVLLLRSDPAKSWTATEVANALYNSPEMALRQLRVLADRGLLLRSSATDGDVFQYRPVEGELMASMERLAELYRQRPVSVITAIYAAPTDTVRTFADAFRLRKENP